jgi:hypothetical protein
MNEDRITNTKTFSDIYFSHSDRTLSRDIWYAEDEKLLIMFDYDPAVVTRIIARVIDKSPHTKLYIKELHYEINGQTGTLISDFHKDISNTYIAYDENGEPLLDEDGNNIYITFFNSLEEIKTSERIAIDRIEGEVKDMVLKKIFAVDDGPLETEISSYKIEMTTKKVYTNATSKFFAWMRILTFQDSLFSI